MNEPCADYNLNLKPRYEAYLKTQVWAGKRMRALTLAGYKCELCGLEAPEFSYTPIILDVHHLTYDRLGYEAPEDLQVLCRPCHSSVHNITN